MSPDNGLKVFVFMDSYRQSLLLSFWASIPPHAYVKKGQGGGRGVHEGSNNIEHFSSYHSHVVTNKNSFL